MIQTLIILMDKGSMCQECSQQTMFLDCCLRHETKAQMKQRLNAPHSFVLTAGCLPFPFIIPPNSVSVFLPIDFKSNLVNDVGRETNKSLIN